MSQTKPVQDPATKAQRRSGEKHHPSYPALLLTQNKHRFYFATIPVDDLVPSCFVARRDEDPEAGFQRVLSEDRADDIAAYLASGSGSIPSNIVLSAQEVAGFAYERSTKSISFHRVQGAFLALDGQHRLYGYSKCKIRHRVPVAIYDGLTRAEEARLFIDINTNQRGVPAALLLDIKRIAEIESEKEGMLRDFFDQLHTAADSPLRGKMSPAKSIPGKISRVAFNRAVGEALDRTVLREVNADDRLPLIRNYLTAFEAELHDKSLITRSAFFEAMFEVLDDVVSTTMANCGNLRVESLRQTIRPLAQIDYSAALRGRTKLTKASRRSSNLPSARG